MAVCRGSWRSVPDPTVLRTMGLPTLPGANVQLEASGRSFGQSYVVPCSFEPRGKGMHDSGGHLFMAFQWLLLLPGVTWRGDGERHARGWQHVHVLQVSAQSEGWETVRHCQQFFELLHSVALIRTTCIVVSTWQFATIQCESLCQIWKRYPRCLASATWNRLFLDKDFTRLLMFLIATWKPIHVYHYHICTVHPVIASGWGMTSSGIVDHYLACYVT